MIRTCSVLIVAIAMMLMASTVFGQPPTADHPRLLPGTCDGYRIQALDLAPVSREQFAVEEQRFEVAELMLADPVQLPAQQLTARRPGGKYGLLAAALRSRDSPPSSV